VHYGSTVLIQTERVQNTISIIHADGFISKKLVTKKYNLKDDNADFILGGLFRVLPPYAHKVSDEIRE